MSTFNLNHLRDQLSPPTHKKPITNRNVLQAKKAEARQAATALLDKAIASNRGFSDAEQEQFNRLKTEMEGLDSQLEQHSTLASTHIGHSPEAPGRRSISQVLKHATGEQLEQFEDMVAYATGRLSASATLTPGGDAGVLIPSFVAGQIEMNVAAFTPVLNASRVIDTPTGADFVYPVLSDSESAVQLAPSDLTGLDATVSGDTPPTQLTGPTLKAWKISSKPILIPRETTTDSGLDIFGDLLSALVARVARYENLKYTRGVGTTECEGFVKNCTHYDVITPLDLDMALDLTMQVPPLYRPNGVFMASDKTIKYLRRLKTGISGDKRPLWSFGDSSGDGAGTEGTPTGLWGYPILVNNDLPDIADSGYIAGHELAFGDFSRFVIRRAENGVPFMYAWPVPAKDGRGLITFRRSDSRLLVPEAVATLSVGGS